MAKLGENIRTARLDCNLSQEQLAKMLGIKYPKTIEKSGKKRYNINQIIMTILRQEYRLWKPYFKF